MQDKKWVIRFTQNDREDSLYLESARSAGPETAALRIRDRLFPVVQPIPVQCREAAKIPTVYQLVASGVAIVCN